MITHEQPGDTFWDKIRAGAQECGGGDHNIDLKYSNNQDGAEQANPVQKAIDAGVNAIAMTLSRRRPRRLRWPAIDPDIPVVGFNRVSTSTRSWARRLLRV